MNDHRTSTPVPEIRPNSAEPRRRAIRTSLALGLLGILAMACARTPLGPPFGGISEPSGHRGRLYLYRTDLRGSLAAVHVTIDGRTLGRFRNNEYETLELAPGTHRLRAALRGFGFTAWGWSDHEFSVQPGETLYLEFSIRLTDRPAPASSNLEIAGRTSGAASENVFIVPRVAKDALPDLRRTTRLTPIEPDSD